MTKYKNNLSWIFLVIMLINLFITSITFVASMNNLKDSTAVLNKLEYLSSSTQRIIKLKLEDRELANLVNDLNITAEELKLIKETATSFGNKEDIVFTLDNIYKDWDTIKTLILEEDTNYENLYFAGERHFYHSNILASTVSTYIENISSKIIKYEFSILISIILIAFLIIRKFLIVKAELKLNKEIANKMFVDTATGLYDRSKCQELFKNNNLGAEKKSKAVIVFDLNDLKKANDLYGHKVGDELISSFAKILKDATKIHSKPPFLGRYGGDEFIVYYTNIDKEDVLLYLKEISYLADDFNLNESKFQVSYAVGYCVADENSEISTFRELFDDADKAMYENKVEMKRKKADESKEI